MNLIKQTRTKYKITAWLLAIVMILCIFPISAFTIDYTFTGSNAADLQALMNKTAAEGGGKVTLTTPNFVLTTSITVPSGVILDVKVPGGVFTNKGHITIKSNAGFVLSAGQINVNNSTGGYGFTIEPGGYATIIGDPNRLQDYVRGNTSWVGEAGIIVSQFLILYDLNGSPEVFTPTAQPKLLNINSQITLNIPIWLGHSFKNWNTKADGTGTTYASGAIYSDNANVTLYAQWNETSTVSFENGDTTRGTIVPANFTGIKGGSVPAISVPLTNNPVYGYEFGGWVVKDTTTVVTPVSVYPAADVIYVATWVVNDDDWSTVSFENGDTTRGTIVPANFTGIKGGSVPTIFEPDTDDAVYGYEFAGWVVKNTTAFVTPVDEYPDDDIIYVAVWKKIIFNIIFIDWNGAILDEQEVPYGESAIAPTVPGRSGYTFVGWDKDYSFIESDLVVNALYNLVNITITNVKIKNFNKNLQDKNNQNLQFTVEITLSNGTVIEVVHAEKVNGQQKGSKTFTYSYLSYGTYQITAAWNDNNTVTSVVVARIN